MEPDFWHSRWQRNEIGFHEGKPNDLMVRYVSRLKLRPGARLFVPLCGKSADLIWLVDQGFRVAGVELSPIAVEQFFAEIQMTPEVSHAGRLVRYSVPGLVIDQGDFFDLTAEILGEIDAVYDRAALVALPPAMRQRYASHLTSITACAPQLLLSFDYDPASREGPPFSVPGAIVHELYDSTHKLSQLERTAIESLKGARDVHESAWLLEKRGNVEP